MPHRDAGEREAETIERGRDRGIGRERGIKKGGGRLGTCESQLQAATPGGTQDSNLGHRHARRLQGTRPRLIQSSFCELELDRTTNKSGSLAAFPVF